MTDNSVVTISNLEVTIKPKPRNDTTGNQVFPLSLLFLSYLYKLYSLLHLTDGCGPDVCRRIGIVDVDSVARIWSQDRLALATKWGSTKRASCPCSSMVRTRGRFAPRICPATGFPYARPATHSRTQVAGQGYERLSCVKNVTASYISHSYISRISLFGHVARLVERVPACSALRLAVDIRYGVPPSPSWRRPRGRPVAGGLTRLSTTRPSQCLPGGAMQLIVDTVRWRNTPLLGMR